MINPQKVEQLLYVTIRSKEKLLFEGNVKSMTSKNERGIFDVLPSHANFISLISSYIVLDFGLETEKNFALEKGLLYLMQNKVSVYVGL